MGPSAGVTILLAVLAGISLAESRLEPVWSGKLRDTAYSNDELGISLTIIERPEHEQTGGQWGSGRQDVVEKDGKRFATWIRERDERAIVCSVPLEVDVVWRLIRESTEPPEFRFVSIANLHHLETDRDTMAMMLAEGVRIPDAWVRGHAWSRLRWFPDREKVAHLLPAALTDPSLDIAHGALPTICEHFGLVNEDGTPIELTMSWRGPSSYMYRVFHKEVELVAERLHAKNLKLLSAEDLEAIRKRRVPSEEFSADLRPRKAGRCEFLFGALRARKF